MKRLLHTCAPLALALALLPPSGAAAAETAPTVKQAVAIDGGYVVTSAINRNGSLSVPAAFFRKLGASVRWNEAGQAVVVEKGGVALSFDARQAGVVHRTEGTYIPFRQAASRLGMDIGYNSSTNTAIVRTGASASAQAIDENFYWMAQLTEAEAGGEPFDGKVAVAASILNRVDSPDWPNTVKDVVFQIVNVNGVDYYQYSPVLDGRIYKVEPSEETRLAVEAALAGEDPTNGATVFYNPDKTDNAWVRERPVVKTIGNHVFAR